MKTVLLVYLGFMLLNAEHIRWFGNYDKAHQEALKENKALMVFLIKENSMSAKKMLSTTFQDQDCIERINKKFVSVMITQGKKESYPIEMLYTLTYPALFFLNHQELFIGENLFGYVDAKRLQNYLDLHVKN